MGESDEQLMGRIKARDESALRILTERFNDGLLVVIFRYLYNHHDAEEVLHRVWLEVWEKNRYDESRGMVKNWLITLARRRAIDCARMRISRDVATNRFEKEYPEEFLDRPDCPRTVAQQRERAETVRRALTMIPKAQFEAVNLVMHGHTYRSTAAILKKPEGTVWTRLKLGFDKLRKLLNKSDFQIV